MQSWKVRLFVLAAATAAVLSECGCNSVVIENPLASMVDDRIVGSWATPDGKLYAVIKKGDQDSYLSLSSDDLTNNGKGTVFYLAKAGPMLFAESPNGCDQFLFKAPSATDAPKGCWQVSHLVLSADALEYDLFDSNAIVRKSIAGGLREIGLAFGVSTSKGASSTDFDSDVLIEGQPGEVGPFLAAYSSGAVYSQIIKLHRI
jgi:hypothetical protein